MSQISKINPEEFAISVPTNVISCIEISDTIEVSFISDIACPARAGVIAANT